MGSAIDPTKVASIYISNVVSGPKFSLILAPMWRIRPTAYVCGHSLPVIYTKHRCSKNDEGRHEYAEGWASPEKVDTRNNRITNS